MAKRKTACKDELRAEIKHLNDDGKLYWYIVVTPSSGTSVKIKERNKYFRVSCNSEEVAEKHKIDVLAHYTAQQDIALSKTEQYVIIEEVEMDGVEDLGNIAGDQPEVVEVLVVDDLADKNAEELRGMIVALRAEKDVVVSELKMATAQLQLLGKGKIGSRKKSWNDNPLLKEYHDIPTDVKDNMAWTFFKKKNAKQQKRTRGQQNDNGPKRT